MTTLEQAERLPEMQCEQPARRSHLERIFAVLTAFQETSTLTLADLTRRVNLPKTTVHRIVHELLDEGVLTYDGDTYRVGLRLFAISMNAPYSRLRDAAGPVIRQLAATTQTTVGLAVLDGTEAVYLDRVLGPRCARTSTFSRPGFRRPAHSCAAGKVLIATSGPFSFSEPSAAVLEGIPVDAVDGSSRLVQELADARQRRVAIEHSPASEGPIAMAAAVPDPRNGPSRGALMMRGPFRNTEQAADVLRRAATVVGERLASH